MSFDGAAVFPNGLPTFDFDVDNDSADAVLRCFSEVVEAGWVGVGFVSGKVTTDAGEGVGLVDGCGEVETELVSPEGTVFGRFDLVRCVLMVGG